MSLALLQHRPAIHATRDAHLSLTPWNVSRPWGADVRARSTVWSRSALHDGAPIYYTVPDNLRTLLCLLETTTRDYNVNAMDAQGFTAWHHACLPGLEGNPSSSAGVRLELLEITRVALPLHVFVPWICIMAVNDEPWCICCRCCIGESFLEQT